MRSLLLLIALLFSFSAFTQSFYEFTTLTPTDPEHHDQFGGGIAMYGNHAFITAIGDRTKGSAYVFKFENGSWSQSQKFKPDSTDDGSGFGNAVAMTNGYAIVGFSYDEESAIGSGSAMIYKLDNGQWTFDQKVLPTQGSYNDRFGNAVDIHGDYAIVGAMYESGNGNYGAAYIFHRTSQGWQLEQRIIANTSSYGDNFANSVAITDNYAFVGADRVDIPGSNAGVVYVFEKNGNTWSQVDMLSPSDASGGFYFGSAIDADTNRLAVSALDAGPSSSDEYGQVYIFEFNGTDWTETQKILAPDPEDGHDFGKSVSISGNKLAVGAIYDEDGGTNNGAVYFYTNNGNGYSFSDKSIGSAGGGLLGMATAIYGNQIIAGAPHHGGNGANSGLVYVYQDTATVSIAELYVDVRINLFPNPVRSVLYIESTANEPIACNIYDLQGRIIKQRVLLNQRCQIDCSDLPAGMYQVVLIIRDQKINRKLIKH
jgi:hypothetical protein